MREVRIGRRRFLADALRYVAAGALLAGGSALVFKRGDACVKVNECSDCGRFGNCDLARAIQARTPLQGDGRGDGRSVGGKQT